MKTKLIVMITACIISGSHIGLSVTAQEFVLGNTAPGMALIDDPEGDYLDPLVRSDQFDIRSIKIERRALTTIELTYEVTGQIPSKVDSYTAFVAKIDIDQNDQTGKSDMGLGVDLYVHVFRDVGAKGWSAKVYRASEVYARSKFDVIGVSVQKNKAHIKVRSDVFRNVAGFDCVIVSESLGSRVDRVPNDGPYAFRMR